MIQIQPMFRAAVRLLAILLCFCLSLGALDGRVLCVGADGHVAVERSIGGRCGDFFGGSSATHAPHVSLTEDHDSHCGPCFDIALNTGHFGKPDRSSQKIVAPVQALSPLAESANVLCNSVPSQRAWHFLPPPRDGALSCLRTTILLI